MNSKRKPKIVGIPDVPLLGPSISDPPVTRKVALPPIVSIKYLAEVCGVSAAILSNQIGYHVDRSVSFQIAAGILRKYGIEAIVTTA